MNREAIEAALAAEVERVRVEGGSWWPGVEIAPIAYRRWNSFHRRSGAKNPSRENRVSDLIKGLRAAFEPEFPYTHQNEWMALGERLAAVFEQFD